MAKQERWRVRIYVSDEHVVPVTVHAPRAVPSGRHGH
jgi:hypothetical protein